MVIMAIVVIAFVLARWVHAAHGDATRFVLAERPFVDPGRAPHGLYVLTHNGYDGQFFYRLALNPSNLHEGAYGFHFDTIFRLQRIGYPVLVWLITGGRPSLVPYGLIFINGLGLVMLGWLGGILARDSGRHAVYGLLIAGFFGFLFCPGIFRKSSPCASPWEDWLPCADNGGSWPEFSFCMPG
jgi:hypothetical protein